LFDEVEFDDELQKVADRESIFKRTPDLKYYLLSIAFIGLGYIVIKRFSKK
tara:strand:+ start:330 stop:482 length:153 start_codon:yes stop_codon:yes gene_type:complete